MASVSSWRVLVADDEPAARRGVRQLLAAFPDFQVSRECRDGREVLAALESQPIDVVFLDIQMPEIDGFEVIRRRTPEAMPPVVFLTAYDQFAIKAFEAEALDYLVKPVSQSRFNATMRRLSRRLAAAPARAPALVVTTSRGHLVLPVTAIDWIEAADNYVRVWCAGKSYLRREPMRALEDRIRRHGFLRAHRRAIVRVGAIGRLTMRQHDWVAVLESGMVVPVARRRRRAIVAALRARAGEA